MLSCRRCFCCIFSDQFFFTDNENSRSIMFQDFVAVVNHLGNVSIFYIDKQFISMQGFVNIACALRVLFKIVLDVKEHVSHGV